MDQVCPCIEASEIHGLSDMIGIAIVLINHPTWTLFGSPASGMSHCADVRRASGGVGRGAARSASAPYHAAVAGRPPYRWRGRAVSMKPPVAAASSMPPYQAVCMSRPPYRWLGRAASPLAAVNRQDIRKFMQYTAIIHMNSCSTNALIDINYYNANALFDMLCGNSDICLTQPSEISGHSMTLIHNKPLQLGCRSATMCGQGGIRYV